MLRLHVKNLLSILPLKKFNTFTPKHAYLGPIRERLPLPLQMQLFRMYIKFASFSKKKKKFELLKDFWSYWFRKTWLLNCIKCPISENPSRVNVLSVLYESHIVDLSWMSINWLLFLSTFRTPSWTILKQYSIR